MKMEGEEEIAMKMHLEKLKLAKKKYYYLIFRSNSYLHLNSINRNKILLGLTY
jgi:hypothetical protein